MRKLPLFLFGLVILRAAVAPAAEPTAAELDFFEKKIRPVLVQSCYECHSSDAKTVQGGLLLDSRESTRKGGDSGPAVVPGDVDESLLVSALRYDAFEMPPKGKLPEAVINDFAKWIEMGAPDPRTGGSQVVTDEIDFDEARQFWAFQPIHKPDLPSVVDAQWAETEIDRFVLARLEAVSLRPVTAANPTTLVRRIYFDLVGLPPTAEQIDAFLTAVEVDRQAAIEGIIDELLDSNHFGERWGRYWLDVARFAESSGGGRTLLFPDAWRYRDYVIASFNQDKPFDQFIREQIAGDLLTYDSPTQRAQQLTGTGFLVLGPTNYELQDKELLRMEVVDEQIDTMGRAFLAMTIGCARCHDHKFDPIPTTDYYALAGIFRSTKTLTPGNVSGFVQTQLPIAPEHAEALATHNGVVKKLSDQIAAAKKELATLNSKLPGGSVHSLANLDGIVVDDVAAKVTGSWTPSTYNKRYIGESYLHDQNQGKGQKSVTFTASLPASGRYEVRLAYTHAGNRASNTPVVIQHADGKTSRSLDQRKEPPIAGRFVSLGEFSFDRQAAAVLTIANVNTDGHVIADAVQYLPLDSEAKAAVADSKQGGLGDEQLAKLQSQIAAKQGHLSELESQLAALKKNAPTPAPQVMSVRDEEELGDYFVCVRGNVHKLGSPVPRGSLTVIDTTPFQSIEAKQSGRLQLANWIASLDNPLTARVFVNRVWHHLFGAGLVRTTDNFGTMGEPPSHPELLDWLASDFVQEGWSMKRLIRQIMLSRVYQLDSLPEAGQVKADPENRLLAHQNRRRLDAEAIRDAILSVSGQLDPTPGGPAIKPGTTSSFGYQFTTKRRGVYVPVFRNTLLDLFEVFDFADPNLVIGRRNTSAVPTQALFMMNSPFISQESLGAARRLLADSGLEIQQRVDAAYRGTVGRPPSDRERELAIQYIEETLAVDDSNAEQAWAGLYQSLFACIDFRYLR